VPGSDVDELLWGNGPFIAITNEREKSPDDKTVFEAASRIIKLGERENLTLDKAVGCVACSKPAHKRRKKDLASSHIEHHRKQSTQGSAEVQ
jgi:hypothetical protein